MNTPLTRLNTLVNEGIISNQVGIEIYRLFQELGLIISQQNNYYRLINKDGELIVSAYSVSYNRAMYLLAKNFVNRVEISDDFFYFVVFGGASIALFFIFVIIAGYGVLTNEIKGHLEQFLLSHGIVLCLYYTSISEKLVITTNKGIRPSHASKCSGIDKGEVMILRISKKLLVSQNQHSRINKAYNDFLAIVKQNYAS